MWGSLNTDGIIAGGTADWKSISELVEGPNFTMHEDVTCGIDFEFVRTLCKELVDSS